jgi:hypothetical protein
LESFYHLWFVSNLYNKKCLETSKTDLMVNSDPILWKDFWSLKTSFWKKNYPTNSSPKLHSLGLLAWISKDEVLKLCKPLRLKIFHEYFWVLLDNFSSKMMCLNFNKFIQRMGSELTMRSVLEVSRHFLLHRFELNHRR